MSGPVDDVQVLAEIAADLVKKLDSIPTDEICFPSLQEYYLESIYVTLDHGYNRNRQLFHLNPIQQKKLVEICIQVIESQGLSAHERPPPPLSLLNINNSGKRKNCSARILTLIALQPFVEPHSKDILGMIQEALVKNLRIPSPAGNARMINPGELGRATRLMGLSAFCLAQQNFAKIRSPVDAHKLIKDLVLPLAVWCLGEETKASKKIAYKVLENNFHCFYNRPIEPIKAELEHGYTLVFRLLLALTAKTTVKSDDGSASDSGGVMVNYLEECYSALDRALETDQPITNEHIVLLNVIAAQRDYDRAVRVEKLLTDYLAKSELPHHRAHIAFMTWRLFSYFVVEINQHRGALAKEMLNDLITKNDELLVKVALRTLFGIQHDRINWRPLVSGKELIIFKRLLETTSKPELYFTFLQVFDHFKELQSSSEFDQLAIIPLSQTIYKIDQLNSSAQSLNLDEVQQLYGYFRCLENLIRLRRHRLDENMEMQLMELFDQVRGRYSVKVVSPVFGILLIFANCYQMRQQPTWNSIIELIRFAGEDEAFDNLNDTNYQEAMFLADTINVTLSYFLITDSDYFWTKFATLEVLELIYNCYKKTAISFYTKTSFKELLITWPKQFELTKLSSDENRTMLNKFIVLLINTIEKSSYNDDGYDDDFELPQPNKYRLSDLLSGLLVAYTHHRELFHEALVGLGRNDGPGREYWKSWLGEKVSKWIEETLNCAKVKRFAIQKWNYFIMNEISTLVVVYELLMKLKKGDSHLAELSSELTKSSDALMDVVKSSLDNNLERAPVDSIESKRYEQIKTNLACNQHLKLLVNT